METTTSTEESGIRGLLDTELSGKFFERKEAVGVCDGVFGKSGLEQFQVECEVLDSAFAKFDIGVADTLGDNRCIDASHLEHVISHVNADHAPCFANHLGSDEADFSGS